jgi:hypothetical protein
MDYYFRSGICTEIGKKFIEDNSKTEKNRKYLIGNKDKNYYYKIDSERKDYLINSSSSNQSLISFSPDSGESEA